MKEPWRGTIRWPISRPLVVQSPHYEIGRRAKSVVGGKLPKEDLVVVVILITPLHLNYKIVKKILQHVELMRCLLPIRRRPSKSSSAMLIPSPPLRRTPPSSSCRIGSGVSPSPSSSLVTSPLQIERESNPTINSSSAAVAAGTWSTRAIAAALIYTTIN